MGKLLGIDVGGTKVAFALADPEGRLLAASRRPTLASGDPQRDVDDMLEGARALLDSEGVSPGEIASLGLSLPGPVDAERGTVLDPPNLPGWGEVPIAHWMARHFPGEVRVENDANAAALAEWRYGAGQGSQDMVYLSMSTGVGGGIVAGGQLVRGHGGNAGEVGHVPVEWEGLPCACGQRGCLEAYVGGRAWAGHLREAAPETSRVLELAPTREAITPVHLVEAAHAGDAWARTELSRWNDYLARGIVALAFTLSPEVVVLGTIAVAAGEALCIEPVTRIVSEHVWPGIARGLQIRAAVLGDELASYAGIAAARYGASSRPR